MSGDDGAFVDYDYDYDYEYDMEWQVKRNQP
jgi:hypothetical protein